MLYLKSKYICTEAFFMSCSYPKWAVHFDIAAKANVSRLMAGVPLPVCLARHSTSLNRVII